MATSSTVHAKSALVESPSHRSYIYVGGQYIDNGDSDDQHVMTGQMYVEKLVPVDGVRHPWPLVLIHGAGQTGTVSAIHSFLPLLYLPSVFVWLF